MPIENRISPVPRPSPLLLIVVILSYMGYTIAKSRNISYPPVKSPTFGSVANSGGGMRLAGTLNLKLDAKALISCKEIFRIRGLSIFISL